MFLAFAYAASATTASATTTTAVGTTTAALRCRGGAAAASAGAAIAATTRTTPTAAAAARTAGAATAAAGPAATCSPAGACGGNCKRRDGGVAACRTYLGMFDHPAILQSGGMLSGKHLYFALRGESLSFMSSSRPRDLITQLLPTPVAPHGPLAGHRLPLLHNALCHARAACTSSVCPTDFDLEWDSMHDHTVVASVEPYESELTPQQVTQLQELIDEYRDLGLFSKHDTDLGLLVPEVADKLPFKINVTKEFQHNISPYRMSEAEKVWFDDAVPKLHDADVVEPALDNEGTPSPYASSPWIVNKKEPDSFRFTVDFREVNAHTMRDAYPLPDPAKCLNSFAGSRYFTALDLTSGYWQIPIHPDSRKYTAFRTSGSSRKHACAHYQYKRMPMGLTNACAHFQRVMSYILIPTCGGFVVIYLDDVVIHSATFEEHLQHLRKVFAVILAAGLKLKERKCFFAARAIKYLGHIVSSEGTHVDPEKTAAIRHFPTPHDRTSVRSFLGMVGYYAHFLPDYATMSAPLHKLTGHLTTFEWGEAQQQAFDRLKDALISPAVLRQPDYTKTFMLSTDWSQTAIGAVLSQLDQSCDPPREYPVAFASRLCSLPESRYAPQKGECLALVWAVQKFRPYLHGRDFEVYTDHHSLRWLLTSQLKSAQLWRWVMQLQEYRFVVHYRKGVDNVVADALSRACALPPGPPLVEPELSFPVPDL